MTQTELYKCHKSSCTSAEDGYRLEILDLELEELYYLRRENKSQLLRS